MHILGKSGYQKMYVCAPIYVYVFVPKYIAIFTWTSFFFKLQMYVEMG